MSLEQFSFDRSKGVVWVCDLADSSKYLNDNQAATELELFLPRLYWAGSMAVEAAGGQFIKWTGDGFLAWFELPLHRNLGETAAAVFQAAWHLTTLINVTQLGVASTHKFRIRHGVAYERDALLIKISHVGGFESLDLIGRDVVLAFRLSSIKADSPNIVTQRELVDAHQHTKMVSIDFVRWTHTDADVQKHFKGEPLGTNSIYVSGTKKRYNKSRAAVIKQSNAAIAKAEGHVETDRAVAFVGQFLERMNAGPEWCQEVINTQAEFFREIHGLLKQATQVLSSKQANGSGNDIKR